jgi:DNA transposition AAA+ family ATPase
MKTYFPKLRSAQVVEKALDRICEREIIGVIVGNPGCGKSESLKHWRRTRNMPHLWIEATLCGTVQATIGALAEGVGVARGSIDSTAVRIAERMAERPMPVLFDEFDYVCSAAMNKLRAIWDRTQMLRDTDDGRGFALALLGTGALRTRLTQDEDRCEQVLRRIGEFDTVPKLSRPELLGVLGAKWNLSAPAITDDAVDPLLALCRGSIGWLDKIVPLALDLAAKDGKVVTPKIVRATSRYLVGVEEG